MTRLTEFIARRWSVPVAGLGIDVEPLHGGLESSVTRARITGARRDGVPRELVVKRLSGTWQREAGVYESLWRHLAAPPAVRLFGRDVADDATYLYLEHATSPSAWPWADTGLAAQVCVELARLHDCTTLSRDAFHWDYERELTASADSTLALAESVRDGAGQRLWRRLGDLRRVVGALPALREALLRHGTTVIHGDVHPGNVIARRDGSCFTVVLVDWARARIGSPMEDVGSWLQSLGCWEPQARRRHDTLMRAYLQARRVPAQFGPALRAQYWTATVSNGLAGAIRYHLAVLGDPAATEAARAGSRQALAAWQRVVRRAAALIATSRHR